MTATGLTWHELEVLHLQGRVWEIDTLISIMDACNDKKGCMRVLNLHKDCMSKLLKAEQDNVSKDNELEICYKTQEELSTKYGNRS